jgi:hypothetical protein
MFQMLRIVRVAQESRQNCERPQITSGNRHLPTAILENRETPAGKVGVLPTAIHTPVRLADGGSGCFTTTAIRKVALGRAGRFYDDLHMSMIESKQRVVDHGEVFTPAWMVDAMLDLVGGEADRIDSRFLEPACGSANFLVRVLQRKLAAVEVKFRKSDFLTRHYALLGLMCIYGIELLSDSISEARENMLAIFSEYSSFDAVKI